MTLDVRNLSPQVLESIVAAAEASCADASVARPAWREPWLQVSAVYLTAWDAIRPPDQRRRLTERMREAAGRALELDPENPEAHHRAGLAEFFRGYDRIQMGLDPQEKELGSGVG